MEAVEVVMMGCIISQYIKTGCLKRKATHTVTIGCIIGQCIITG